MKPDPTIDSIREVRHQISVSVGHDARKLVEHYRKLQARHPDRVFSRATEKPKPKDKNVA
jgi:hypothetical protein